MNQLRLILIILLFGSSIVFASNVIRIQTTSTMSGDTGTFTIIMKNDVSVNGLHFILQYEPNLITPIKIISVDRAGILTGSIATLFDEDKINFLAYDQGYNFIASDSGIIFEVEYIVKDSLSDSTKAHLVFTEAMAADSSISILPFEFINGEISISPSVGVKETPKISPIKFELCQNYPNPFNPTSTIRFDIPKASFLTLKVYNVLGQEVATLVNEKREAGKYEVKFNASTFSSGVYFYRLTTETFIDIKKCVIIK